MSIEVLGAQEFERWFDELSEADAKAVTRRVDLLETVGSALPFPYSSDLRGTRYTLRELRIRSGRRQLRVLYAFDGERRAILLLGGDKTSDARRFYKKAIRRAEQIWERYCREKP